MIAILGAGALGGALAHRLADRGRVPEIRLIDEAAGVASGKALDIRQTGPIGRFETRVIAASDPLAAAGASAIVVADAADQGEWTGEGGVASIERLRRAGSKAPLIFAGANQIELMEACFARLGIPADRLLGTAASAVVGAVRSLVAAELDASGVDVHVALAGCPPGLVVAWSSATAGGQLITERLPAHRLLAMSGLLARLWPPGPYAIASATATIVEALVLGSRQRHQALAVQENEPGARGEATMQLLELGHGRILGHALPTLSPVERQASASRRS
jgi:hypothetical protein